MTLLAVSIVPQLLHAQDSQKVISEDTFRPEQIITADLDGDGDQDVLSASMDGPEYGRTENMLIAWHENQLKENDADNDGFGDTRVIHADAEEGESAHAKSVYAADLDGDGDKDVMAAYDVQFPGEGFKTTVGKIAWYENQIGEGEADSDGFGAPRVVSSYSLTDDNLVREGDLTGAIAVRAGDLDGDEDMDLIATGDVAGKEVNPLTGKKSFSTLVFWFENKDSRFSQKREIESGGFGAPWVYVSDLNMDETREVLYKAPMSDRQAAWREVKEGSFGERHTTEIGHEGWRMQVADLDGDKAPDLLSLGVVTEKVVWHKNHLAREDAGGFGTKQLISTRLREPSSIYAADLNGDGKRDVIAASAADNRIAWSRNMIGESRADEDGFGLLRTITKAELPTSVYAADLDGDGDQDILFSSKDGHRIAWYENTPERFSSSR